MDLVDRIALAALLHDIGKFYQRTGLPLNRPPNWHDYVPSEYSYLHALYTYQFFVEHEDIFQDASHDAETSLINLASRHHNPSNPYECLIAFADRRSSALDRSHCDKLAKEEDVKRFRTVRLKPIFEEIRLDKHDYTQERFLYPLSHLSPQKLFPEPKQSFENLDNQKAKEEYQKLWQQFCSDLKRVKSSNFWTFFNAIKSLLEKYTWCIPSATIKTVPDVSLYDHLITTSAIATALFKYYEAKGKLYQCSLDYLKNTKEKQFCFITGDFSGIQSFIFDHGGSANKYAAKILRAKSFFVSLATEIAAYLVIQKFGLNPACLLSTAAGKFLVLAPNLDQTDDYLKALRQEIRTAFHKRFYGEVNFCLASLKAGADVFDTEKYAPFMTELALKLEEEKLRPIELDPKLFVFKDYFEKIRSGDDICAICGKRPKIKQIDDIPVCKDCLSFKEIGESLVKESFISLGEGRRYQVIGNYGFEFIKQEALPSQSLKKAELIYQIVPKDSFSEESFSEDCFSGYPLKYIARQMPKFKENNEWHSPKYERIKEEKLPQDYQVGSIKTFYHLACDALILEDDELKGSAFLGILKADVDNLGRIFREGLKRKNGQLLTASRYAYLSRMFDAFFSLYIPYIASKNYPEIYTVFTGGDDLFLIGPYTQIYQFALKEIGKNFKRHVCYNEDITISAGITFAKPAVPVREMAQEAESLLEQSKKQGKNAITIFGQTLSWAEFNQLATFETEINEIETIERLPTAYFYRLLSFSDWAQEMCEKPRYVRWRALFAYITARNFRDKPYYERLLNIGDKWIERYKAKLKVPLSIAIYRRRK